MSKCICFLVRSSERYRYFKQSPEIWPLWVLTLFRSRANFVYKLSSLRISDVPGRERMHYSSTVSEVQASIPPFSCSKHLDHSKSYHTWSHRLQKAMYVFPWALIQSLADDHRKSPFCLVFFLIPLSLRTYRALSSQEWIPQCCCTDKKKNRTHQLSCLMLIWINYETIAMLLACHGVKNKGLFFMRKCCIAIF